MPRSAIEFDRAVEIARDLVAEVAERALGVLHDVSLVDERDRLVPVCDRIAHRAVHEALGAQVRDRLDADADLHGHVAVRRADAFEFLLPRIGFLLRAEADLVEPFRKFLREKIEQLLRIRRTRLELDASIDVLGILAEDRHVHPARIGDRRRHAFEPAHRTQAHIQIEHLPQGDVERADAAADRGGQRALDRDEVIAAGGDGFVGQPVAGVLEGLLAGEHFHPHQLALAAVGFRNGRVEHAHRCAPDIGAGAVAFDERNDRMRRYVQSARRLGDALAAGGRRGGCCGHGNSRLTARGRRTGARRGRGSIVGRFAAGRSAALCAVCGARAESAGARGRGRAVRHRLARRLLLVAARNALLEGASQTTASPATD